jgi:hypothetical protein
MGDCGAFTYVNEKYPQIDIKKASDHYNSLEFDYGISVDHICSDVVIVEEGKERDFDFIHAEEIKKKDKVYFKLVLSNKEKEFRRQLSLENAKKFLEISYKKNYTPIGAVQGYSIESYMDSAIKLIDMGYKYIAFGGLVPKKTEFISNLLDEINKKINTKEIKVHLLGVLREELFEKMINYNIASFDSASYYRKSWLRATHNYLGVDNNWYPSIRIPQSENPRMKNKILTKFSFKKVQEMEEKILKNIRKYDQGLISDIDSLLEDIINYDKIFFRESFNEDKFFDLYKTLLHSKNWKECACEICKTLGVDVVIFRGSDRNKRRGFHNTFVFYKNLQEKLGFVHFDPDFIDTETETHNIDIKSSNTFTGKEVGKI